VLILWRSTRRDPSKAPAVGRSSGSVPKKISGMAVHAFAFLDALASSGCDVLGYSLGGMVAQQALVRPAVLRRLILVGTRLEAARTSCISRSPAWQNNFDDPQLQGYAILQKIFFAPTEFEPGRRAAFIDRLMQRKDDREPVQGLGRRKRKLQRSASGRQLDGERFADLRKIHHPTLW